MSKLDEQFHIGNFVYDDDDDDNDIDDIKRGNENQVMMNALSGRALASSLMGNALVMETRQYNMTVKAIII